MILKTSALIVLFTMVSESSWGQQPAPLEIIMTDPSLYQPKKEETVVPKEQPRKTEAPSVAVPQLVPAPGSPESLPKCSDFAAKVDPTASKPVLKVPDTMMPTLYDDGFACPGGCKESHVVFDPKHNGTSRAHIPGTKAPEFGKCVKGQQCKICFKENSDCMTLKYEGDGPPFGRFDFPVIFFQQNCKGPSFAKLPESVQKQCGQLEKQKPRYADRINCIAEPEHGQCRAIMNKARQAKENDSQAFNECKSKGESAFNAVQATIETKRAHNCAYSLKKYAFKSSTKKDHSCHGESCERVDCKKTWSLLMPAACPQGSYVGKYGLNCCSGDLFWQIALGNDCEKYFPKVIQVAIPKGHRQ